jgi:nucleotide-binding universal stress UspA family protein
MTAAVMVGVDGADDGRRALRYGIDLAKAYDAPLRLVHVRHENPMLAPMLPMVPDPTLLEVAESVLEEAVGDARKLGWTGEGPESVLANAPRVAALVDQAHDARCMVLGTRSSRTDHLLTGSTTNERPVVALHTSSRDTDLVIIGQYGRHVRFGPRLGTTARTVIRTSACPVLVIPTPFSA